MNLAEGQFQLGGVKFGKGTPILLSGMDQVGYSVSPGDYHMPLSDELRFRKDYLQPGTMQFGLSIPDNFVLPGHEYSGDLLYAGDATHLMERFKMEWSADEVRSQWGWTKPLSYCGAGQQRVVFGRPRDITSDRLRKRPGWYSITASYQTADRLSYSAEVFSEVMTPGSPATIHRGEGLAPSWMSAVVLGPCVNPVIQIGPFTFQTGDALNPMSIPEGGFLEISSYAWDRKAILRTFVPVAPDGGGASPNGTTGFWANVQYILRAARALVGTPYWRLKIASVIDSVLNRLPSWSSNATAVAEALNGTYSGSNPILSRLAEIVAKIYGLPNPSVGIPIAPADPTGGDWVTLNVGARLIGDSPWLDDLRIPAEAVWDCTISASSGSPTALVQWREAHHAI